MGTPLRALIVEDSSDDAALLVRELERGGYDVTSERVDTREGLADALERGGWEIVFADYTMPQFRGSAALQMVRSSGREPPFIFVSGTIGEDVAVEAMKAGADDYVIKGNLKRLVPAVARELRDAVERRERQRAEAERRAAEEALRASEERHRVLFQHIDDVILLLDRAGVIRFASASLDHVVGYSPEVRLGHSFLERIHPDDAQHAAQTLARVISGPEGLETVELRVKHDDGSWRTLESIFRNLLQHPDIQGVVVTGRDVTQRNRLQAEFLQAQKLEAVGQLAGGVAHDFNNLLTVVLGECDLLLEEETLAESLRESVKDVRKAAERGASLTRQLLTFSRRQLVEPEVFNPDELVRDLGKMFRRLIGEHIKLDTRLHKDIADVFMDRGQLEQVLVNLVVNARDAMPGGGSLTIETSNVTLGGDEVLIRGDVEPGDYVLISVSDTGSGMSAEVREHLFEPFFTTKEKGQGSGLGLATSYGIVRQHRGHIGVYTEEGLGSTFRVYLPQTQEGRAPSRAPRSSGELPTGTETVLVVEDDESLRAVGVRLLERLGYRVHAAATAADALAFVESATEPVQLLFTDVVLPDLGGRELAEQIRKILPQTKVLFASGYTEDVILRHQLLERDVKLLGKPFTIEELARHVREALDA